MLIWRTRLTLVLLTAVVGGCAGDRTVAVSPTQTSIPTPSGGPSLALSAAPAAFSVAGSVSRPEPRGRARPADPSLDQGDG